MAFQLLVGWQSDLQQQSKRMALVFCLLAVCGFFNSLCNGLDPVNVVNTDTDEPYEDCTEQDNMSEKWCSVPKDMLDKNFKCWVTSYRKCFGELRVGDGSTCRHVTTGEVRKCAAGYWDSVIQDTRKQTKGHSQSRPTPPAKKLKRVRRFLWGSHSHTTYVADYSPVISCPSSITTTASAGTLSARVSWSSASASDDRSTPSVSQIAGPSSGSTFSQGSTVIQYRATDSAGQTADCQFTVTVTVLTCPALPSYFPHGTKSCSGSRSDIYGSVCSYACNAGYRLSHTSNVQCNSNRAWSSNEPVCQAVSCGNPGSVAGGQLTCPQGVTYPNSCLIECRPGYQHTGVTSIQCAASATWTASQPCKDVQAPAFPSECPADQSLFSGPLKSAVSVSWNDPAVTDNSADRVTLTYSPAKGSLFGPGSHKVSVTATDLNGNSATCQFSVNVQVHECRPVQQPSNGRVNCTADNVEGSECVTSCDYGYNVNGTPSVTCLASELWNGPFATCEAIICPEPPGVPFGQFLCSNGHQCPAVCTLACNSGFVVNGSDSIRCLESGQWSPHGFCSDVEAPVFLQGCPDNIAVSAEKIGVPTRVSWLDPAVADNSGDVTKATGDVISGSIFPVGHTTVTYTVADTSGNVNSCRFNVTVTELECGDPTLQLQSGPDAKGLECSCPHGHVYGAECRVSCSQGSRLQGRPLVTCERDDSTHPPTMTWTWGGSEGVKPQCLADSCPELPPPKHGALSCYHGGKAWECYMSCELPWDVPFHLDGRFVCYNEVNVWTPDSVPDCVARRLPQQVRVMADLLYFTGSCNQSLETLRHNYISYLNNTVLGAGCASTLSCVAENIEVSCGPVSRHRRHAADNEDVLMSSLHQHASSLEGAETSHYVHVTFHVTMPYAENTETPEDAFKRYSKHAAKLMNAFHDGQPKEGLGLVAADHGPVLNVVVKADCPQGTLLRDSSVPRHFSCVTV